MSDIRHNWQAEEVEKLYNLPLMDLLYQAQTIHRRFFNPNEIQLSSLLSIKTGSCPEDCAFCPQSAHYDTGLQRQSLMSLEEVLTVAQEAKANGASRFCMGAAWRNPPKKDFPKVLEMIKEVKKLGLETCATLGMLDDEQAAQLKEADLDYYNHNLETSPEFYKKLVTTARTYEARLDTLKRVRESGIKVCCGGILGMGETRRDRIGLLLQLANLPEHPESVPINYLLNIEGTPLEKIAEEDAIDYLEYLRTIAIARIMIPGADIRLSCGRQKMTEEMQILCFFAGANSFFYGDKLLTRPNCKPDDDQQLLARLGMKTI